MSFLVLLKQDSTASTGVLGNWALPLYHFINERRLVRYCKPAIYAMIVDAFHGGDPSLPALPGRASLQERALSFSKHAENYLDAIHLFVTTYNFRIKQAATLN